MVFSKSYCPYSRALRTMLDENMLLGGYGVFEIDVVEDGDKVHEAVKEISGWMTIPNVFIDGKNVGGDEDVEEMASNGELKTELDRLGIQNTF